MSMLEIHAQHPADTSAVFHLKGVIDGDAKEILGQLRVIHGNAVLDFSGVQRVNSMGLALLLTVFRDLHGQGARLTATGMNRMTAMLFKMTGVNQYLIGAAVPTPPESLPDAGLPMPVNSVAAAAPPVLVKPSGEDFMRLSVNLQERAQLEGWYFLNTYLQRRWGRLLRLEPRFGALDQEYMAPPEHADIAFVSPFDVCSLISQGFSVLRFPLCPADEAVIVCRGDDHRQSWADFERPKILTARLESYVYLLGRLLMDESGFPSEQANYLFVGNDIKVVQMLLRGMGDLVILPKRVFAGLAALTREDLRVMDETQTDFAFHALCVAPHRQREAPAIAGLFDGIVGEGKGQQILDELGIHGWRPPQPEEVDMLMQVYRRYI
ncbi:PhnD/SsuA/transferrin family substrate-binding protein [Acidithiobacillus sulfuriphilus]|nr:PhnD/SsuA/transferrin family substrate-binding protein [Acidithiobacillus sulfuriphilus]